MFYRLSMQLTPPSLWLGDNGPKERRGRLRSLRQPTQHCLLPGLALQLRECPGLARDSTASPPRPALPSSLCADKQGADLVHTQFRRDPSGVQLRLPSGRRGSFPFQAAALWTLTFSETLQPAPPQLGPSDSLGGQAPPAPGINLNTLEVITETSQ